MWKKSKMVVKDSHMFQEKIKRKKKIIEFMNSQYVELSMTPDNFVGFRHLIQLLLAAEMLWNQRTLPARELTQFSLSLLRKKEMEATSKFMIYKKRIGFS